MNTINIVLAVVAQFAIGFVWYGFIFGKVWGQMHDFDKLSKKEQKEMQAKMGPWYGAQLAFTVVTTVVLAYLMDKLVGLGIYELVFFIWLGFVLPAQAGAAIFGGAKPGWTWHKILISSSASLVSLIAAAAILSM